VTATPRRLLAAVSVYLALLLVADRFVDVGGQLVLGAVTWLVLVAACRPLSAERRAQVAVVVAVATCGEIVGSIVWGLYTYRLENLPAFVPPGHGLVYVGGLALSASCAARPRVLVGGALAAVLVWGAAGVTVLPRPDAGGAVLAAVLAVFLLAGRAPTVYAGVFAIVAGLELWGTALGTWTWAATAPGTPVTQGNPPSGIAAGYVVFDIAALALAVPLLAFIGRVTRTRTRLAALLLDPARAA